MDSSPALDFVEVLLSKLVLEFAEVVEN